jgi:riboflavin kinase/FMN adenylyltransferase
VHLFDFSADIYGRQLQVDLLHRIRDEMRFESLDALTAQITRDVDAARGFFADRG